MKPVHTVGRYSCPKRIASLKMKRLFYSEREQNLCVKCTSFPRFTRREMKLLEIYWVELWASNSLSVIPPMLSSLTCMEKRRLAARNDFLDSQLRKLIEMGTSKLLVNLTDVTQLDSSSIASIVRAFSDLRHRGASLKLLRPRGNVKLVLETVHLLDVIPSVEDETEAIASFN